MTVSRALVVVLLLAASRGEGAPRQGFRVSPRRPGVLTALAPAERALVDAYLAHLRRVRSQRLLLEPDKDPELAYDRIACPLLQEPLYRAGGSVQGGHAFFTPKLFVLDGDEALLLRVSGSRVGSRLHLKRIRACSVRGSKPCRDLEPLLRQAALNGLGAPASVSRQLASCLALLGWFGCRAKVVTRPEEITDADLRQLVTGKATSPEAPSSTGRCAPRRPRLDDWRAEAKRGRLSATGFLQLQENYPPTASLLAVELAVDAKGLLFSWKQLCYRAALID